VTPEEARDRLTQAFGARPDRARIDYRPLWIMAAIVVLGLVVIATLLSLRSMHVL
jgi:hypothetical protein